MSTLPDDALTTADRGGGGRPGWLLVRCLDRPVRLLERQSDRWVMPLGIARVSWIGSVTGVAGALALAFAFFQHPRKFGPRFGARVLAAKLARAVPPPSA